MFYEIEVLDENHPGAFGQLGAYGQGYSLFGVSLGLSTMAGPAWGGTFLQLTNWQILAGTMAALSVVGSIPVYYYTGGRLKKEKLDGEIQEAEEA